MSTNELRQRTTSRLVRENVLEIGGRFHVALDLILDRGGTSTVYAGRQISVAGRPVAVKVYDNVPKDPEERARFRARMQVEVQAAGGLKNFRIVSVIDAGVIEDGPLAGLDYVVMEYVGGGSLAARIEEWAKRDELPAPREIVHVLREVGLAIEVFESNKIVHRDLKPANVLYEQDGSIKVIDLGMARIDGNAPTLTRQGIPVGTPVYMSPEQSRGESLDSRSDLWSLGAIVFHMATGRPPVGEFSDVEEDFIEALSASAYLEEPRRVDQLVPGFPTALATLIARLLSADPDDRFANVRAFLTELEHVAAQLDLPAPLVAPKSPTQELISALEGNAAQSAEAAVQLAAPATRSDLRAPEVEPQSEAAPTSEGPPEPGRVFVGRYRIVEEAGSGASGRVYVAYDERLLRDVALKMLRPMPTDDERQRFLREAQLAAKLPPHPNLVALFDAAFVKWGPEEQPYIVMELVRGQTLADRVEASVPWREALEKTRQALEGLAVAHEAGLVHRDIKPANLLVDRTGRVKVADFGIAKRSLASGAGTGAPTLTEVGTILGTPGYMSPEQVSASPALDGRSDIYSIGVVLYELMSARMPYADEPNVMALLEKIKSPTVAPLPLSDVAESVPAPVARFVHRLLEKDPAQRPQTAHEAIREIDALLAGHGATAATPAPRRARAIVTLILIAIVAPIGAWWAFHDRNQPAMAKSGEHANARESGTPPPAPLPARDPGKPEPPKRDESNGDPSKEIKRPEQKPDAPQLPSLRKTLAEYSFNDEEKALLGDLRIAFSARGAEMERRDYSGIESDLKRLDGDTRQSSLTRRFAAAASEIVVLARTLVTARVRELADSRDATMTLRDGTVVKGAVVSSEAGVFTVKTDEAGKETRVALADLATSDFARDTRARPALAIAVTSGEAGTALATLIQLSAQTEDLLLWLPIAVRRAREDAAALVGREKFTDARACFTSAAAHGTEIAALMGFLAPEFALCRDEAAALELFEANHWGELIPRFPDTAAARPAAERLLASFKQAATEEILWPDWWTDWQLLPKPGDEGRDLERLDILKDEAQQPTILKLRDWDGTSRYVRTTPVDTADQGLLLVWRARWRDATDSKAILQIEQPADRGALLLRMAADRAVLVEPVAARELRAGASAAASSADAWRTLALIPAADHLFVYLDDALLFHVSLKEARIPRAFALAAQRAELHLRSILVKPTEKK